MGDGIENPHNARTLFDISSCFDSPCLFLDRKGLAAAWSQHGTGAPLPAIAPRMLPSFHPIIACDRLPGSVEVFGFRQAPGPRPALVVGNERLGITHTVQALATQQVHSPLANRGGIDSLNVAAAAAVVLYSLSRNTGPIRAAKPCRVSP